MFSLRLFIQGGSLPFLLYVATIMQLLCANVMQPKLSEDSKSVEEWTETNNTVLPIVWSRINITRELFLDGKM